MYFMVMRNNSKFSRICFRIIHIKSWFTRTCTRNFSWINTKTFSKIFLKSNMLVSSKARIKFSRFCDNLCEIIIMRQEYFSSCQFYFLVESITSHMSSKFILGEHFCVFYHISIMISKSEIYWNFESKHCFKKS